MITNAIVDDPKNPRLPLAMCKLLRYEQRYADAVKLIKSLPDGIREKPRLKYFMKLFISILYETMRKVVSS